MLYFMKVFDFIKPEAWQRINVMQLKINYFSHVKKMTEDMCLLTNSEMSVDKK